MMKGRKWPRLDRNRPLEVEKAEHAQETEKAAHVFMEQVAARDAAAVRARARRGGDQGWPFASP